VNIFARRPFVLFALLGLFFIVVIAVTGIRHDSGGAASVLYYVGAFFCLPFWLLETLLRPLAGGQTTTPVVVTAVAAGFLAGFLLDGFLHRLRRKRKVGGPQA
jgi:hypothetical protein